MNIGQSANNLLAHGHPSNNRYKNERIIADMAMAQQILYKQRFISLQRMQRHVQHTQELNISLPILSRICNKCFQKHCNEFAPKYTELHKYQRLRAVVKEVDPVRRRLLGFLDVVLFDEKWFYLSPGGKAFWRPIGVDLPENIKVWSKTNLTKIMVLCAVA